MTQDRQQEEEDENKYFFDSKWPHNSSSLDKTEAKLKALKLYHGTPQTHSKIENSSNSICTLTAILQSPNTSFLKSLLHIYLLNWSTVFLPTTMKMMKLLSGLKEFGLKFFGETEYIKAFHITTFTVILRTKQNVIGRRVLGGGWW